MAEPETPTAEVEGTQETQQGPDISAIAERMDSFAQELGGLREALIEPEAEYGDPYGGFDPYQGQQPGPQFQQAAQGMAQPFAGQQPYAGQQPDPYGQYQQQPGMQPAPGQVPGGQVLYDEWGNPVPVPQPQQQQEQVPPWAQQLMEQTQGLQTQFEQQQVLGRVAEYEARYPELKNPEVFRPAAEAAQQKAIQMGRPELAGDPDWVVTNWLADRAANSAGSETPAGSAQEMQLEQPGGVAPEQPEAHPGDRIVDAIRARQFPTG